MESKILRAVFTAAVLFTSYAVCALTSELTTEQQDAIVERQGAASMKVVDLQRRYDRLKQLAAQRQPALYDAEQDYLRLLDKQMMMAGIDAPLLRQKLAAASHTTPQREQWQQQLHQAQQQAEQSVQAVRMRQWLDEQWLMAIEPIDPDVRQLKAELDLAKQAYQQAWQQYLQASETIE